MLVQLTLTNDQRPAATLRCRLRDHSSPITTSTARVAENKVRSSVRPAYRTVSFSSPSAGLISAKTLVLLDWSSRRLNHAAMKEEIHLESLVVALVSHVLKRATKVSSRHRQWRKQSFQISCREVHLTSAELRKTARFAIDE